MCGRFTFFSSFELKIKEKEKEKEKELLNKTRSMVVRVPCMRGRFTFFSSFELKIKEKRKRKRVVKQGIIKSYTGLG
jgi:hypothetical protein